jgi:hypothetical protein
MCGAIDNDGRLRTEAMVADGVVTIIHDASLSKSISNSQISVARRRIRVTWVTPVEITCTC